MNNKLQTCLERQRGFTLVEMMITVAIVGILSVIAVPSYQKYVERGYLSQAHAELVAVNNGFKTELVKNPSQTNSEIQTALSKYLANFSGDKALAEKYTYSAEMPDSSKSRRYNLVAVPTASSGYTLALWMDSLGNAYKCTDSASAQKYLTEETSDVGCEKIE
ncbi:PilX family type IV pilin [Neisseria perflava]|uniref:PilX family type IV pilin n=1 Tax=Neisseria perflava TaxID=33053 RepID=UPI0020A03445|nr:PilX family type IV pilin [Neisseria perflava]MCP1660918.1 type IV pilus assembly protein PilE [Neisseria perflava]